MTPLLLLIALVLAFVLVSMLYGRIANKVECLFCEAMVPRFYTSSNAGGKAFVCAVCQRARLEYPFGSTNLPQKKACANCKRRFYPLPHLFLAGDGNGPAVCRYCVAVDIGIKKALKQYAAEKGVELTDEVAEEWAQNELDKMRAG